MESLSDELNSSSLPSFEFNSASLIQHTDDPSLSPELALQEFQSSVSPLNILNSPSPDVPLLSPVQNFEEDPDRLLSLLNLEEPLTFEELKPPGNLFDGHFNQLLETDFQPQVQNIDKQNSVNWAANESNRVPNQLLAIAHATPLGNDEVECPTEITPIPRVLQPTNISLPSLNLSAIISPRHAFPSKLSQPFPFPLSAKNISKRRYYGSASSSRYCHICGRGTSSPGAAKCSNSRNGTCRKIVCEKCMLIHDPLNANVHDRNQYTWVCTHCRMKCPASARCHQYARNNMKRRLRNQAKAPNGIKKQSHENSKVWASKIMPTAACDHNGIKTEVERMNDTDVGKNVSRRIECNMVDLFFASMEKPIL
ncbi:hypothetical protein FGB62_44g122 [Gracilaria domingensis]|nr:hypothetical protein FGB62_44g122 [Gracilaria domingensis]